MVEIVETALERVIREWEAAAESDGMPPKISDKVRELMALEYLKAKKERSGIRGWPIIGMTEVQHEQARALDHRMGTIFNIIRESTQGEHWVPDSAALAYINQIAANSTTTKRSFWPKFR